MSLAPLRSGSSPRAARPPRIPSSMSSSGSVGPAERGSWPLISGTAIVWRRPGSTLLPERSTTQEKEMGTFTNKVAVITGGNSGIGLATAKEFSRHGAKVVISGRDQRTLTEAAASIGGETLAVRADVSRLADLD